MSPRPLAPQSKYGHDEFVFANLETHKAFSDKALGRKVACAHKNWKIADGGQVRKFTPHDLRRVGPTLTRGISKFDKKLTLRQYPEDVTDVYDL